MSRTVSRTGNLRKRSSVAEGGEGEKAYLFECVQKIFSVCDALRVPVQKIFGLNGVCRSALSRHLKI